jgi:hypothetical protein
LNPSPSARKTFLLLFALTVAAIAVQGYHPATEDAEIYTPGILKILHPSLYPYNAQFFQSHAHLTLFPNLIAASIRLTRLYFSVALLLWQLVTTFLLLWGCHRIARLCFAESSAAWCAVSLIAGLLSLPVAGTALILVDPYLTTRSFSTPCAVLAVACVLEKRYASAILWILFTAAIHPLMAVFAAAYLACLFFLQFRQQHAAALPAFLVGFPRNLFPPVTPEYREILQTRSYFFLTSWEWYEWLGLLAPFAILAIFMKIARRFALGPLRQLCSALILFGSIFFALALVIARPGRFENLAELQPLRFLHLLYVLMFLLAGGFIGKFLLKEKIWRWAVLFVPLSCGMAYAQHETAPNSAHLELPGRANANPWVQAFEWIRDNTPEDAYFALNPRHMALPGEDQHGFRAISQRSMLADAVKDSGAASMFPPLAKPWMEQVTAQKNWNHFTRADLLRLKQLYGVNWVVLEQPGLPDLSCPYHNDALEVCRLD